MSLRILFLNIGCCEDLAVLPKDLTLMVTLREGYLATNPCRFCSGKGGGGWSEDEPADPGSLGFNSCFSRRTGRSSIVVHSNRPVARCACRPWLTGHTPHSPPVVPWFGISGKHWLKVSERFCTLEALPVMAGLRSLQLVQGIIRSMCMYISRYFSCCCVTSYGARHKWLSLSTPF